MQRQAVSCQTTMEQHPPTLTAPRRMTPVDGVETSGCFGVGPRVNSPERMFTIVEIILHK